MSRIRIAQRSKVKLKLAVSGLSGSGKTYSSLLIARGFVGDWSKIGLIDSENGSGELYSHLGPYQYIDLRFDSSNRPIRDPHSPENYSQCIKEMVAAGVECIVVDSITHEWDGIGGCLESVERLGGRFADWAKVTPRHKAFVDSILQADAHIIVTMRKKSDYLMGEEERNGKTRQKIEKVGMKDVQREGVEYEFTLQFTIDRRHFATAEKDRTGLFTGTSPILLDGRVGEQLLAWANSGTSTRDVEATTRDQSASPRDTASLGNVEPRADEVYTATDAQKRDFATYLRTRQVTDVGDMRLISGLLMNKDKSMLDDIVDQFLKENKNGHKIEPTASAPNGESV